MLNSVLLAQKENTIESQQWRRKRSPQQRSESCSPNDDEEDAEGGERRKSLVKSSMAAQKLYVLLIQEPGLVNGMEKDVNSIHQGMLRCLDSFENFIGDVTERLRDIAYDVEDFIEDPITLKLVTKRRSSRKKLEKIKVKIRSCLKHPCYKVAIETKLVENQNIAQTVVSPVIVKVTHLTTRSGVYGRGH